MIAKSYRSKSGVGAHERSHTEAFFRKVKFWDGVAPGTPGMDTTLGLGSGGNKLSADSLGGGSGEGSEAKENSKKFGDAPPVFIMPDGYSYMHVKRNGLIFGCATEKNISPVVVIEVSIAFYYLKLINDPSVLDSHLTLCTSYVNATNAATLKNCKGVQRLLWYSIRRINSEKLYPSIRTS